MIGKFGVGSVLALLSLFAIAQIPKAPAGLVVMAGGTGVPVPGGGSDTTPNQFSFTDQTDVALSSTITSAAITVSGIDAASTITVSGGTYDKNSSGSFTSSAGTVVNTDTIRARHTSSGSNNTATNTTVTIGGISDTFTSTTLSGGGGDLPQISSLQQDGLATPEQISLVVPVSGTLTQTATATIRYRLDAGPGAWVTGHPLFRVRQTFSNVPAVGTVGDDFAWPIIDLQSGTAYDIEATVSDGTTTEILNLTTSTRALPATCGTPNKTANSAGTIASQFAGLNAGDVLEIANGSYTVSGLTLNRSGTAGSPICIRGQSRTGVTLTDTTGDIIEFLEVNHVIIENMTMVGSAVDDPADIPSGNPGAQSCAFCQAGNDYASVNITVRNIIATGVDRFVDFYLEAYGTLVYDNTITGNNLWNSTYLSSNRTWNDHGIQLPGDGNAAFNNTMTGLGGDSFSFGAHVGNDNIAAASNIHFYRNEIRNSTDDVIEADHAIRNVTWYDNRVHNSINCDSIDPLYGGPFLSARNICINPARVNVHKWNDNNTGQFLYSNTVIATVSAVGSDPDVANWYQPNNGDQRSYGYRNNLHVYRGAGQSVWLENTQFEPVDWTNNAWYPNRQIQFGSVFANLAAAQSGISNTTPIFSGAVKRFTNDVITVSAPWTTTITLGANALTEYTGTFLPTLSGGDAAKNAGIAIPNITDGFSGAAPDIGAVIAGRTAVTFGDRTAGGGGSDTTPDSFSFTDQTGVALSSTMTSAAITVTGINAAATITVSGGTYDKNSSGSFTSSAGTVVNSDTVRARHTSSGSNSTATNTTVTIGGVSDTFTSTTLSGGGGTPAYISALSDYQALQLTTTSSGNETMEDVTPSEWLTSDPGNGLRFVVDAWAGGGKALTGTKLYINGGGHTDSANNGVYIYDFTGTTQPTGFESPIVISTIASVSASADANSDGKAQSVHTYDGLQFHAGALYRFGGAKYSSGGGTNRIWKFSGGTWTSTSSSWPVETAVPVTLYDPVTGNIFGTEANRFAGNFYRTSGDTLSANKTLSNVVASDPCAAFDPTRGRGVVLGIDIGSGASQVVTLNFTTETASVAALSASGSTAILGTQGLSCFYDSARDVYWIFGGVPGSLGLANIYEMNASTFAITAHALSGSIGGGISSDNQGTYGRFVFLAAWRAIGIVTRSNGPAWIIKIPN